MGKRLVGLGIATPDGDSASIGAKLTRNIPLCIPIFPIVEFFVAYYGDEHMQRLGDKFANTRVIDLQPDTKGKGTWSAQLVVSVVILMAAQNLVIPAIVSALS